MDVSEVNIPGYAGKFLRIDLSTEKLSDVVFDEDTLRKYIGGTGLGVKILYDEVSPTIHWSEPSNRVILASGPLGGTTFPGTGTFSLVTKGALTGGCMSSQANYLFGAYLRFSGYDGVIVQGAAKRWKYVNIKQDEAEFKEASHLLGRDTYETGDLVKKELGKKGREMSVVSIGPAGENNSPLRWRICGYGSLGLPQRARRGPWVKEVEGYSRLQGEQTRRGKAPRKAEIHYRQAESSDKRTGKRAGEKSGSRKGLGDARYRNRAREELYHKYLGYL